MGSNFEVPLHLQICFYTNESGFVKLGEGSSSNRSRSNEEATLFTSVSLFSCTHPEQWWWSQKGLRKDVRRVDQWEKWSAKKGKATGTQAIIMNTGIIISWNRLFGSSLFLAMTFLHSISWWLYHSNKHAHKPVENVMRILTRTP